MGFGLVLEGGDDRSGDLLFGGDGRVSSAFVLTKGEEVRRT